MLFYCRWFINYLPTEIKDFPALYVALYGAQVKP